MSHLRSWLADHIVKVVGFLGTLAALGFSTIYICNNVACPGFPPPKRVLPNIVAVSPAELYQGQEADVTGTNLREVSAAHLTEGQIDKGIFLLAISDTRLIVSIPKGIDPETYNLELKIDGKDNRLSAGKLAVITPVPPTPTLIPTPTPTPTPTIIFANLNWDSVRMQNAIARYIVENGCDYPTDTIPDLPGHSDDV